MTNPNLSSELTIRDPAEVWQPRQSHNSMSESTGIDPSGYARSVMQDGNVFSTETGKASIGSTREANEAQNQAARVPFDYATHPVTGSRVDPYQLQEDSIVHFGGASMTIAQARAADFLPPGWMRPGTYPDQVQAQRSERMENNQPFNEGQEQQKEEVHPDLQFDVLANEQLDRDYSNLVDTTGGVEQHEAISQIVESGEISARTIGVLSSQLGVEPQQLQARIAPIMKGFEDQARTVMGEGGVNADDVIAFAQQHRPDKLRLAMNKQATMRQVSGYVDLRQDYLESLADHSPEVALKADLGSGITQYSEKGKVIVRLADGTTLEWRSALRSFGVRKN